MRKKPRFDWKDYWNRHWETPSGRKRRKTKTFVKKPDKRWLVDVFIPETTVDGRRIWEPMHRIHNVKVNLGCKRFVASMSLACRHFSR